MALNRVLYQKAQTNIVSAGVLRSRFLMSTATTGLVNTATNEYGQAADATIGRGLTLGAQTTGRFTVSLPSGASVASIIHATATVSGPYGAATQFICVPEAIGGGSVVFQAWSIVATPGLAKANTALSAITAPAALTGPAATTFYIADNTTTSATTYRVPMLATNAAGATVVGVILSVVTAVAASTTAGSFVVGRAYYITAIGTTDFTTVGASANVVGTKFLATAAGAGTGTASNQEVASATVDTAAADLLALLSVGVPGTATTWTYTLPGNFGTVFNAGSAAFATQVITAPSPVYVSVSLEFTDSKVVA